MLSTVLNTLEEFNITDFNNWKDENLQYQRTQPQIRDNKPFHNDTYTHDQGNYAHYDDYMHLQGTYAHYDDYTHDQGTTPHYDSQVHDQGTYSHYNNSYHSQGTTSHTDTYGHDQYETHVQSNSDHYQTYMSQTGHSNSGGHNQTYHADQHINNTTHMDYMAHNQKEYHIQSGGSHYDSTSHSQSGGSHYDTYDHAQSGGNHYDTYVHSQSGGTHYDTYEHDQSGGDHYDTYQHSQGNYVHDNFIPSVPELYKLSDSSETVRLKGVVTIGLHSYDKNNDGEGSQDTQSKVVKYTLRIRKIKDLDGTKNESNWVTLLDRSTSETYLLDTVDPLKTGNTDGKLTEGYYELQAIADNDPITMYGETRKYESAAKTVTVIIQQNQDPVLRVNNGSDFINFYFGHRGGYSPSGVFKEYSPEEQGITVKIKMRDPDDAVDQWQKGTVHLEHNGKKIAGSEVDVVWSNGSTIIKSDNIERDGSAFIPKAKYLVDNMEDVTVVITVKDYLDSACTQPAGATVVQSIVGGGDNTRLEFNVDRTNPTGVISGNPDDWVNHDIIVNLTAQDVDGLGIRRVQLPDGQWVYSSMVSSPIISKNGIYRFVVEDLAGNQTPIDVNVTKIDKVKPTIKIDDVVVKEGDSVNESKPKTTGPLAVKIDVYDEGSVENPTGISKIKEVRYAVTSTPNKPTSGWISLPVVDGKVSETITLTNIGDNYVHVEAYDNAGNYEYGYKGNYRINAAVKISGLKIIDGDPGIVELDGNRTIPVRGIETYVLRANNFRNTYTLNITNNDDDKVKLYYTVTHVDTGEVVYSGESGEIDTLLGTISSNFSVRYYDNDLLENWKDGVYEVKVVARDYDTNPDAYYSEDEAKVYILIKRNAPPKPIITATDLGRGKNVTIVYPDHVPANSLFNDPDITKYYKKQYQVTAEEGLLDYNEPFFVDKNCTVAAIYTDICGNVSMSVLNIVVMDEENTSIGDGGNIPARTEESRTVNKYFINIRKTENDKIDFDKLQFIKKLKK